jgi:hypothetical protein
MHSGLCFSSLKFSDRVFCDSFFLLTFEVKISIRTSGPDSDFVGFILNFLVFFKQKQFPKMASTTVVVSEEERQEWREHFHEVRI